MWVGHGSSIHLMYSFSLFALTQGIAVGCTIENAILFKLIQALGDKFWASKGTLHQEYIPCKKLDEILIAKMVR